MERPKVLALSSKLSTKKKKKRERELDPWLYHSRRQGCAGVFLGEEGPHPHVSGVFRCPSFKYKGNTKRLNIKLDTFQSSRKRGKGPREGEGEGRKGLGREAEWRAGWPHSTCHIWVMWRGWLPTDRQSSNLLPGHFLSPWAPSWGKFPPVFSFYQTWLRCLLLQEAFLWSDSWAPAVISPVTAPSCKWLEKSC
jgi:hypothetical protein